MVRYARPLTPDEIAAVKDENIGCSDIPELDASFWRTAELVELTGLSGSRCGSSVQCWSISGHGAGDTRCGSTG